MGHGHDRVFAIIRGFFSISEGLVQRRSEGWRLECVMTEELVGTEAPGLGEV